MTESIPERFIKRVLIDKLGRKSHRKMINPEYIRWSLALEDCEMINEPMRTTDWFDYKYKNKKYHTKFCYRPHLGILSEGMIEHFDILNNPYAYEHTQAPEWYKKKMNQ